MSSIENDNDGVETVFDALHGTIDLSDAYETDSPQIQNIVSSPFVQRLRRIKQLGYVSQNFLSAQHNRYSHALGTLHMMRKLLDRLERSSLFEDAIPAIGALTGDKYYDDITPDGKKNSINRIKQHLLVAAVVQDVGELPYEKATGRIFSPGASIKEVVQTSGVDVKQLQNKDLFTLYFIWNEEYYDKYFKELNKSFLTFLIAGQVPSREVSPPLAALRQMIDGAIDADRLDYVYRDAFHALGIHHTPDALIESIATYDERGPILRHVRPVTDFMITRAMLWSSVYLSPENRFRIILLRIALQELCKDPERVREYVGWSPKEITAERFLGLHDLFIENVIEDLHRKKPGIGGATNPVQLLQTGAQDYEYRWVRFGDEQCPDYKFSDTPVGFYWDTYADYTERNHTLYDRGSVRIEGDRYSRLKSPVYLEACMGPFCGMLTNGNWPALPMPNHMAWFAPRSAWAKREGLWDSLFKFEKARQMTLELEFNDPLKGVVTIFDTRDIDDFEEPKIFIAFAWEDREFVKRALAILYERKQKYFVFLDGSAGLGRGTAPNSEAAVDVAGAVLLFASATYVDRYLADSDGPIYTEVERMRERAKNRRKAEKLVIVPIYLDEEQEVRKAGFPWKELSSDKHVAYGGSPLRHASSAEFRNRIEIALRTIAELRASR